MGGGGSTRDGVMIGGSCEGRCGACAMWPGGGGGDSTTGPACFAATFANMSNVRASWSNCSSSALFMLTLQVELEALKEKEKRN
jgi:hypothetical protein